MTDISFYHPDTWQRSGRGPRYQQLQRHISAAILSGALAPDDQLPPERDLAQMAQISRVTVRKAITLLVADNLIEQRQGAGSFVRNAAPKLEQSLSSLVSFTENMSLRGLTSASTILSRGIFAPSPQEILALGLSSQNKVTRINRLRRTDDVPMAIELSSLPQDILPNPQDVETSLYAVLRKSGRAPTRAVQRVTAINLEGPDAELLKLPEGAAVLKIERTGYLASGRPIEFTSGLYRSDIYDFVSELRQD